MKRVIKNENGNDLLPDEIFVIEPYNQTFKSEKISTLLVNTVLKNRYDQIHSDINEKKEFLLEKLKSSSGLRKGVEEAFSIDFTDHSNKFLEALLKVKTEVLNDTNPKFPDIIYSKIFSVKVIAFLETADFKTKLQEYIEKYDELIDSSTYFQKGIFNHNNASVIAKNLQSNGFFKANHSVLLNSTDSKKEIATEKELEELIQQEKETILNDPDLSNLFENIDKKLKVNRELREFRDYLLVNLRLLPELPNLNELKKKLWVSYLKQHKLEFSELEEEYSRGKEEIETIVTCDVTADLREHLIQFLVPAYRVL